MTPLHINILMHYYVCGYDGGYHTCTNGHRSAGSPAALEYHTELVEMELISLAPFKLTDRGQAYILALLAMPLPVKVVSRPVWEVKHTFGVESFDN